MVLKRPSYFLGFIYCSVVKSLKFNLLFVIFKDLYTTDTLLSETIREQEKSSIIRALHSTYELL